MALIPDLTVILREAEVASRIGRRHPRATTRMYKSWDVAGVIRHLGQIHRWVTAMVGERAAARRMRPDVSAIADADLPDWLTAGSVELAKVLAANDPQTPVWAFAEPQNVGFWRRRMALETTIHRWDIEDAVDEVSPIDEAIALAGVNEVIDMWFDQGLAGELGGGYECLILKCNTGARWCIRLLPDRIEVESETCEGSAAISGSATDLWLLLMGRRTASELNIEGDIAVVEKFGHAIALIPGPR